MINPTRMDRTNTMEGNLWPGAQHRVNPNKIRAGGIISRLARTVDEHEVPAKKPNILNLYFSKEYNKLVEETKWDKADDEGTILLPTPLQLTTLAIESYHLHENRDETLSTDYRMTVGIPNSLIAKRNTRPGNDPSLFVIGYDHEKHMIEIKQCAATEPNFLKSFTTQLETYQGYAKRQGN